MNIFATFLAVSTLTFAASSAFATDLPEGARKVSMDEFKNFADGKKVSVEIYDAGTPITAKLVWNWKKKTITGTADVGGKPIKVNVKMSFDGDKACSAGKGEKPVCHSIYIGGNRFYEVRDDGAVHAASIVQ